MSVEELESLKFPRSFWGIHPQVSDIGYKMLRFQQEPSNKGRCDALWDEGYLMATHMWLKSFDMHFSSSRQMAVTSPNE